MFVYPQFVHYLFVSVNFIPSQHFISLQVILKWAHSGFQSEWIVYLSIILSENELRSEMKIANRVVWGGWHMGIVCKKAERDGQETIFDKKSSYRLCHVNVRVWTSFPEGIETHPERSFHNHVPLNFTHEKSNTKQLKRAPLRFSTKDLIWNSILDVSGVLR